MVIGTFGETTGWCGKTVTFDGSRFVLDDFGPISAQDVLNYHQQGHLAWVSDDISWWVASVASLPSGAPIGAPPAEGGLAVEEQHTGQLASQEAWTRSCPACRSGQLRSAEAKRGFLGLSSRALWTCPICHAEFIAKSDKPVRYELQGAGPAGSAVLERYRKKALTETEWERIAQGGLSDEEVASADLEAFLGTVQDGSARFMPSDLPSPVALKRGEELVLVCSNVVLREPRSVTTGVYGGPRIQVAKGLSFNVGGFRAAPHEELKDIDSGDLVLTSKRLIFMGGKRTSTVNLTQVIGVEPYADAVAVHRSNKQRMEMFCNLNRHEFQYSVEGRSYRERLSGGIIAYLIEGLAAGADSPPAKPPRATSGRTALAPSEGSEAEPSEALRTLAALKAEGLITDEEYSAKKAEVLARL